MKFSGRVLRANTRRGLLLSPARASLSAFAFAMLLLSAGVYATSLPALAQRVMPHPTYKAATVQPATAAADVARSLLGSGSSDGGRDAQVVADEAQSAGSRPSLLSSSGLLGSTVASTATVVQRAADEEKAASAASEAGSAESAASSGATSSAGGSSESSGQSGDTSQPSGSASSSANGSAGSSLSSAQESEFRNVLVRCFNALVEVSGSVRESYGRLSVCANTGDFSDAASWYSASLSYDGTIDSVKASLNRTVSTAEQSKYYAAWTELQLATNDLGRASAETVECWRQATSTGSATAAVSAPGYYESYRIHENNARSLL